jgi:hypothetical protein
VHLLRQGENPAGELEQLDILLVLVLNELPVLVGDDLPLGIRSVLGDQDECGQEDRLEGHDHRQEPIRIVLDPECDPAREPHDVHVHEQHRPREGSDLVGDAVLTGLRALLLALQQSRADRRP